MRVLQAATFETGGAATAMQRLMYALENKVGIQDLYFCNLPSNKAINNHRKTNVILNKIQQHFKKTDNIYRAWEIEVFLNQLKNARDNGLEYASLPVSNINLTKLNSYKQSDIIHLHWVANGLDWPTFFKRNKKPIVWTLHDMNPFSGIEHYEEPHFGMDEAGYPLFRQKSEAELALGNKWSLLKKTLLAGVNNINIVSPSRWLLNLSQQSNLFHRYPHFHIPNSVPEEIFKITDKTEARKKLGLPDKKKLVLFVADNLENQRKGLAYLRAAVNQIKSDLDVGLIAVGQYDIEDEASDVFQLGKITEESKMATVYAAADVFIIPSLEDNLPNTMLESLMCGTPVIGFPVGGIQETIQDGFNGYLCERIGVPPLVETIKKFLENTDTFSREAIAADALKKYATDIQAQAYLNLYEGILDANK